MKPYQNTPKDMFNQDQKNDNDDDYLMESYRVLLSNPSMADIKTYYSYGNPHDLHKTALNYPDMAPLISTIPIWLLSYHVFSACA